MLLSEAIQDFLDDKAVLVAAETFCSYRRRVSCLFAFLGDMEVEDISLDDLRRWRRSLVEKQVLFDDHPHRPTVERKRSVYTIRGYLRDIRVFFNWLESEGDIELNPVRRLESPPKGDVPDKNISQDDALAILAAARDDPRDYAILRFLGDTGCRVGGVAGLKMDSLDLQPRHNRCRATVWEKGKGGSRKRRVVYLNPETSRALAAWLAVRPCVDHDFVFLDLRQPYSPLQSNGIYQIIKRYARELGIKGPWNPHAWRHAFILGVLDNGGDLALVSQLAGHASVGVTASSYGHRADAALAEHHRRYSWLGQADEKNGAGDKKNGAEDSQSSAPFGKLAYPFE